MILGPCTPVKSLLGNVPALVETSVSQHDFFPSDPKLHSPIPKLFFPSQAIPNRPFPVQMLFSSLQPEPTESTTYMTYQISMFNILTLFALPRLHAPLPNIGPSLSLPLVVKGCRRAPQSPTSQISFLRIEPLR